MLRAFPPRKPRGFWWVFFSLALVVASALVSDAQQPKDDSPAAKGSAEGAAAKKGGDAPSDPEKQGVVETEKPRGTADLEERFADPNAPAALANTFPELFANARPISEAQIKQVEAAAQQGGADPALLTQYIQAQARDLTRHSYIEAMLDPDTNSGQVKALEAAGQRLRRPLDIAYEARNATFRSAYTGILVGPGVAPQLLKNHLYARVYTMLALSRSADDKAVPVFIDQLNDDQQLQTVQLLAAVGLIRLTNRGRTDAPNPQNAIKAAQALSNFLDREGDAFWPVKARAIEAIGALRQVTLNPAQGKAEFAESVLRQLADPEAKPAVRSIAAWSLGMLRPGNNQYNFLLIALHDALAASDIAARIARVHATNPELAGRLTDLLIQLHEGLVGDPDVRSSGILNANNPNLIAQRDKITEIQRRIQAVAAAALELTRSAGVQATERRKTLATAANDLRTFATKLQPGDLALVPGGDTFPPKPAAPPAAGEAEPEKPQPKDVAAKPKNAGGTPPQTGSSGPR